MTADDQPDGIGPGHADMAARILQRVVGGAGSTPLRSLEAAKGLSDWIDPDTAIAELIDASADLVRHPRLVQHTYRFANDAILTLQMRPVTDGVELTGLFEPVDDEAQPVGSGADRWACQVEAPDRDPLICSLDRGTFAGTWRSLGLFLSLIHI